MFSNTDFGHNFGYYGEHWIIRKIMFLLTLRPYRLSILECLYAIHREVSLIVYKMSARLPIIRNIMN